MKNSYDFIIRCSSTIVLLILLLTILSMFGFAIVHGYKAYFKPQNLSVMPMNLSFIHLKKSNQALIKDVYMWEIACATDISKNNVNSRLELQSPCITFTRNYIQRLSVLVQQHEQLLQKKEEDLNVIIQTENSTAALMTVLGLVITFITLWLGFGVFGMEKLKEKAEKDIFDAKVNFQKIADHAQAILRIQSEKTAVVQELITFIKKTQNSAAATRNISNVIHHLDLLLSYDVELVKKGHSYFSNFWNPNMKQYFPDAVNFLKKCHENKDSPNYNDNKKYYNFFIKNE